MRRRARSLAPFVLLLTRYQLSAWSLHGARYPRTPSFHRLESIRPQAFVAEIDRWELNRPRPIGFSPSHSTTVELSWPPRATRKNGAQEGFQTFCSHTACSREAWLRVLWPVRNALAFPQLPNRLLIGVVTAALRLFSVSLSFCSPSLSCVTMSPAAPRRHCSTRLP